MKIAIFYNVSFGGAKRCVFNQVKGLKAQGHMVDVYTIDTYRDIFDPGLVAHNEYRYAFNLIDLRFPVLGRLLKDYDNFYTLKALHKKIAKEIDQKKYDIALIHTDNYTQAPFILRYLKTKNLYFCLEPLRIAYEYSLKIPKDWNFPFKLYEIVTRNIRKNIDRDNARSADFTTAISLFGREYMIMAYDLYPQVCYLGIDTNVFRPLSIPKKKQVLFVSDKAYISGYNLLEKAFEIIPKDIRPQLKTIIWTKNNSQRLIDSELVKLYNSSLITLSLSRFETFGLVPLESMACGTPVIALNVGGYRETIVQNKNGFLVDFNPEEIAEKIIVLIKNPSLLKSMGKNGRNWVEKKWNMQQQIKHLENILIQIVKK